MVEITWAYKSSVSGHTEPDVNYKLLAGETSE